jgi:hypothetical protein
MAPGSGELALNDRQGVLMIALALGGVLGDELAGLLVVLEYPQAEEGATECIGLVVALDLDSATIAKPKFPGGNGGVSAVTGSVA